MASHSSVLAWRIPGMGEPGGLPSMGSRRVGHDWSDLAAAAAAAVWYHQTRDWKETHTISSHGWESAGCRSAQGETQRDEGLDRAKASVSAFPSFTCRHEHHPRKHVRVTLPEYRKVGSLKVWSLIRYKECTKPIFVHHRKEFFGLHVIKSCIIHMPTTVLCPHWPLTDDYWGTGLVTLFSKCLTKSDHPNPAFPDLNIFFPKVINTCKVKRYWNLEGTINPANNLFFCPSNK